MTTSRPTDRTILVTGGAGFIGSHLSKSLVDNNEVRILDSLTTGSQAKVPDGATFIKGDIRDSDTLIRTIDGIDLIFHEAALVSVQGSVEAPLTSHNINVDATLSLLEAARDENARVILASSAAIYGHPEQVPIVENDRKEPTSPYGLEKLTIDHYANLYRDLYGLETAVLRYFNAYGPGQVAGDYSGVISVFIDQALSGEDITVNGNGEQTRDFVYIDDIVQANCKAATTDEIGDAYNIGTGESVTIRKLAEIIQELTDTGSDIVHTEPRGGDIEHSEANISKAKTRLNYEPTISFREGLERTIDWYQKQ